MQFYEKDFVPFGLDPDWDFWAKIPATNLRSLCFLAFGLEPINLEKHYRAIEDYEKDWSNLEKRKGTIGTNTLELGDEYTNVIEDIQNEQYKIQKIIDNLESEKRKIKTSTEELYQLAYSHLEHGFLRPPITISEGTLPSTDVIASSLYISDFVDWLKSLKIPYPEQLNNCMRMRDKTEDSEPVNVEKELENTRRVLATVLKIAKVKHPNLTQGIFSDLISEDEEYMIKGLKKRTIDGIFAESKKLLK